MGGQLLLSVLVVAPARRNARRGTSPQLVSVLYPAIIRGFGPDCRPPAPRLGRDCGGLPGDSGRVLAAAGNRAPRPRIWTSGTDSCRAQRGPTAGPGRPQA